jgi:curved DNA-binding protein CbpA
MQMFDPYAILGLPRSATAASIKAAYRTRARMTHPDRGGEPAEFMVVVKAFGVLSDPAARRLFDETGQVNEDGARDRRQEVATILAEMFDTAVSTALSLSLPLQRVNFIEQMASAVRKQTAEADAGDRRLQADLAALKALRTRIRRRDGKPNLFVERLDEQVRNKERELLEATQRRVLLETALTELSNYDSEVELFSALGTEAPSPGQP